MHYSLLISVLWLFYPCYLFLYSLLSTKSIAFGVCWIFRSWTLIKLVNSSIEAFYDTFRMSHALRCRQEVVSLLFITIMFHHSHRPSTQYSNIGANTVMQLEYKRQSSYCGDDTMKQLWVVFFFQFYSQFESHSLSVKVTGLAISVLIGRQELEIEGFFSEEIGTWHWNLFWIWLNGDFSGRTS